jgi:tripartite-type tricarboxylate transporter receptor subunit TctC
MIRRLAGIAVALAALATALAALARAQTPRFPSRPIEITVSYGAGGSTDIVARVIAQRLQERLGQPVVVRNMPGASGTLGAATAARAARDGHSLYAGFTTEMAVMPQVSRAPKYSLDDFEPIAVTGIVPVALIGSRNIRADDFAGLIAELRQSPGKYTYGGSLASPSHVMGAWLNRVYQLDVTHVPYRGGAQAVADVSGGHVDMFHAGVAVAKAAIDSRLVKAFAVTGEARSAALPNVPTFREVGAADLELGSWTVLLAPKGTPPEVVALLKQETLLALDDPHVRTLFAAQGVEPSPTQDVRAFLTNERDKFGKVVRELGITVD